MTNRPVASDAGLPPKLRRFRRKSLQGASSIAKEPSTSDTARLVERAQRGERPAQDALWRAHRRWVAAIVLVHKPRALEVDDLMQDVAVKMIDKIDTLREPGAFKPWLRQITVNVCRGSARAFKPTLTLGEAQHDQHDGQIAPVHPVSHEPSSAETSELRDAAERLLKQTMSLPPEYREPLLLRCVRSLTYQQISEILDLPVTTIETRLARARRMLREELGEELGEIPTQSFSTPQWGTTP